MQWIVLVWPISGVLPTDTRRMQRFLQLCLFSDEANHTDLICFVSVLKKSRLGGSPTEVNVEDDASRYLRCI